MSLFTMEGYKIRLPNEIIFAYFAKLHQNPTQSIVRVLEVVDGIELFPKILALFIAYYCVLAFDGYWMMVIGMVSVHLLGKLLVLFGINLIFSIINLRFIPLFNGFIWPLQNLVFFIFTFWYAN